MPRHFSGTCAFTLISVIQKKLIILAKYCFTPKPASMQPPITLRPFHYRGAEQLGLDLGLEASLEKDVRKLKGVRWCGEKGWWYLPLTREHYNQIREAVVTFARLDARWLRLYLEQKK